MKLKFWQTSDFKQLEKQWYKKLEEEGFPEQESKSDCGWATLKQRASNCFKSQSQIEIENKRLYYEALEHFFYREAGFRDDVERLVMLRRSEGVKIKSICEELRHMGERQNRCTIRLIIQKYEKKWNIKRK